MAADKYNIHGIILAGGESKRMGSSKAFLPFGDVNFIEAIMAALSPLTSAIHIIGKDPELDDLGAERHIDLIENAGPLSGLYTGLAASTTEWNLVLSCDVPLITTALLQKLVSAANPQVDVVLFEAKGYQSPLVALYHKRCLPIIENALQHGERRLRMVLQSLLLKIIHLEGEEAEQIQNINTKEDYESLTKRHSN